MHLFYSQGTLNAQYAHTNYVIWAADIKLMDTWIMSLSFSISAYAHSIIYPMHFTLTEKALFQTKHHHKMV